MHAPARFSLPGISGWQPFTKGPHSELFRAPTSKPILAKVIRPRSQPRDTLRKYVNAQARREWRSAFRLQDAGLEAPRVHGWAVSISPFAPYESILFMEEIEGFKTSLRFIRESENAADRRLFFDDLAADMARLHGHGLIHKDGHFGNIGWGSGDQLIWIDNDIRFANTPAKLEKGFLHMRQMLERTARNDVHAEEWRYFDQRLRMQLERWPKARALGATLR
ncbi:hypothetical protein S4A8_04333 [Salinisphaera sp. S4-8]|uniref:lipopolysaccharide kinase InaA family protein n=1 Tax=Salinisphaera sp. S4-8 TaxID=633357 RepID=UPI00333E8519